MKLQGMRKIESPTDHLSVESTNSLKGGRVIPPQSPPRLDGGRAYVRMTGPG